MAAFEIQTHCPKTREHLARLRMALAEGTQPPPGILPGAMFRALIRPAATGSGDPTLNLCTATLTRLMSAAQPTASRITAEQNQQVPPAPIKSESRD